MTISPCELCEHFDFTKRPRKVCKAYPDGIPDKFFGYWGDFKLPVDHHKVEKDQVGTFVFTPRESK